MEPLREPRRHPRWRQVFVDVRRGEQLTRGLTLSEFAAQPLRHFRPGPDHRGQILFGQSIYRNRRERSEREIYGIFRHKPDVAEVVAGTDAHQFDLALRMNPRDRYHPRSDDKQRMERFSWLDQSVPEIILPLLGFGGERLALFGGQAVENRDQIDRALGGRFCVLGRRGLRWRIGLVLGRGK